MFYWQCANVDMHRWLRAVAHRDNQPRTFDLKYDNLIHETCPVRWGGERTRKLATTGRPPNAHRARTSQ